VAGKIATVDIGLKKSNFQIQIDLKLLISEFNL